CNRYVLRRRLTAWASRGVRASVGNDAENGDPSRSLPLRAAVQAPVSILEVSRSAPRLTGCELSHWHGHYPGHPAWRAESAGVGQAVRRLDLISASQGAALDLDCEAHLSRLNLLHKPSQCYCRMRHESEPPSTAGERTVDARRAFFGCDRESR